MIIMLRPSIGMSLSSELCASVRLLIELKSVLLLNISVKQITQTFLWPLLYLTYFTCYSRSNSIIYEHTTYIDRVPLIAVFQLTHTYNTYPGRT